jgi:hypothetical protein
MAITIISILINGVEQLKVDNRGVGKTDVIEQKTEECQCCKKHKAYYTRIRDLKQQRMKDKRDEL